jgi:hypothetical protein
VEMREGSGEGESLDGGKHLEDDVCMYVCMNVCKITDRWLRWDAIFQRQTDDTYTQWQCLEIVIRLSYPKVCIFEFGSIPVSLFVSDADCPGV